MFCTVLLTKPGDVFRCRYTLTVRFALQLGTHLRGKKKREEMGNLLRKMSRKAAPNA